MIILLVTRDPTKKAKNVEPPVFERLKKSSYADFMSLVFSLILVPKKVSKFNLHALDMCVYLLLPFRLAGSTCVIINIIIERIDKTNLLPFI